MAHFAEIDENNVVLRVIVVSNDALLDETGNESEAVGVEFCQGLFGGNWKQTSYNTRAGSHKNGGTPLRSNYAGGAGSIYNEEHDIFYSQQPYPSWILDREKWEWAPPVPYPDEPDRFRWNEDFVDWEII